jgi:phosphatidylglycerol:prolipoprotein diacylglycerol transferase
MHASLTFPSINPVAFALGPLEVHWYGIAYLVGILLGWAFARHLVSNAALWKPHEPPITRQEIDDFLTWAVVGIIVGGRLGYVLFYNPGFYMQSPLSAFAVWDGGMSFHGGATGAIVAMVAYARNRGFSPFSLLDVIAVSSCSGLFFGRIANFVNAELWGRPADVPWAFIFPGAGPEPRHPSQLYEAGLEGIVLLVVLSVLIFGFKKLSQPGFIGGAWVLGYGFARIFVEFFRMPDPQLGYLAFDWLTMGMILSLPMLAIGAWGMLTAKNREPWRRQAA